MHLNHTLKWLFLFFFLALMALPGLAAEIKTEVSGFRIFIWQYQTDVIKDYEIYRELNVGGFHIDRGKGQHDRIRFSVENDFPFYADHVADKGFLYLKGKDREEVTKKPGLLERPVCLSDTRVIAEIKKHIHDNISDVKKGKVVAYALDDEVSLGTFVNPGDVDIHPLTLAQFRGWLKKEYGVITALNSQWGSGFKSFTDVMPQGFETIRTTLSHKNFSNWNLSSWMDFRHFMDIHFAEVILDLVNYSNTIDPLRPAGFVGAQAPSPWGGYDYGLLSESVQWIEAYDTHGTDEILRSFWNGSGKMRMQTFFSQKSWKKDAWFLWYYLLHGNSGAIAWPEGWFREQEGKKRAEDHISSLSEIFKAVQGPISRHIIGPNSRFISDPIGIYYSHPSIQASWVMDALVHGRTWPNRLSSIDNENQSSGVLRQVWCKTIEDLGLQYDFINYLDVVRDRIDLNDRFKVIILPKTVCLSDKEADIFKRYVEKGGVLVSDYMCGIFDEHGKFRKKGALDDVFGIRRDDAAGYLNGKGVTEIDAEKHSAYFLDRFTFYKGADYVQHLVKVERGIQKYLSRNKYGLGRVYYLNLSPLEYWSTEKRFSGYGDQWRKIVSDIFEEAAIYPKVLIKEEDRLTNMIEAIFWKNGKDLYLGLIKNPSDRADEIVKGETTRISLQFRTEVALFDMKNQKAHGQGKVFSDIFNPWEANFYRVSFFPEAEKK